MLIYNNDYILISWIDRYIRLIDEMIPLKHMIESEKVDKPCEAL